MVNIQGTTGYACPGLLDGFSEWYQREGIPVPEELARRIWEAGKEEGKREGNWTLVVDADIQPWDLSNWC